MKRAFPGLIMISVLLLCWEFFSALGKIDQQFYPSPSSIISRLIELSSTDIRFWSHVSASFYRLLLGACISIPSAISLAVTIRLCTKLDSILSPVLSFLYPLPKAAIFPFFLLIFGVGDASKIALIAFSIFFLVLYSALQGMERLIWAGYLDLVKLFRIPRRKVIWNIMVRGSIPEILNGIRLGLGYGLVMVVVSEFTVSQKGIGVFIWNSWDQFKLTDLYCGIFVISLAGFLISYTMNSIHRSIRWYWNEERRTS